MNDLKQPKKAIWKFPISFDVPVTEVRAPGGARFLSAGWNADHVTVWAVVYPSSAMFTYRLALFGTGWDMEDFALEYGNPVEFIGTVQTPGGFVWHVWVLGADPKAKPGSPDEEGSREQQSE